VIPGLRSASSRAGRRWRRRRPSLRGRFRHCPLPSAIPRSGWSRRVVETDAVPRVTAVKSTSASLASGGLGPEVVEEAAVLVDEGVETCAEVRSSVRRRRRCSDHSRSSVEADAGLFHAQVSTPSSTRTRLFYNLWTQPPLRKRRRSSISQLSLSGQHPSPHTT